MGSGGVMACPWHSKPRLCLLRMSRGRAVRSGKPREGNNPNGTGRVPVFATLASRLGIPSRRAEA
jgi:hypothetical protein